MQFSQIIIALFATATCVSAIPDLSVWARALENEIYERDMASMGLARREDHPNHEMVKREVDDFMARRAPSLIPRIHVDCSTLLTSCSYNTECSMKSAECAGCKHSKCTEDR